MIDEEKNLKIMYFIGSEKIRTITLSPLKKKLVYLTLTFIIIGFVTSVLLLFEINRSHKILTTRFSRTLQTLFEYQIKYEGVYDSLYKDNSIKKISSLVMNKKENIFDQYLDLLKTKHLIVHSENTNQSLEINDFKLVKNGLFLEVDFTLIRKGQKRKASGFVSLKAYFLDKERRLVHFYDEKPYIVKRFTRKKFRFDYKNKMEVKKFELTILTNEGSIYSYNIYKKK